MPKTITEIAVDVLEEIGRLPDGQVAPASQTQKVKLSYSGLYEELLNNSLVNWAAVDDIPDFASNSITILLSSRVCGRFGVPNQWLQLEEREKRNLSQQIASPYVSQPTQFEDI